MKKLFPILLIVLLFASCDIAEVSYDDIYFTSDTISNGTKPEDSVDVTIRKILLMDFTGHKCVNCPDAHDVISQLKSIHGEKIVPMAIHVTSLANTDPNNGYVTDFKTETGDEIYMEFQISAIPNGLINSFQKSSMTSFSAWAEQIEGYLDAEPELKIEIENTYNSGNNTLEVKVKNSTLTDINADLKLVVYLLESKIIAKQATTHEPIEDYEHNHVLRKGITETFGIPIFSNPTAINTEDSKTFNITLNSDWIADNCEVIAFIYNNDTKEVINCQTAHLE